MKLPETLIESLRMFHTIRSAMRDFLYWDIKRPLHRFFLEFGLQKHRFRYYQIEGKYRDKYPKTFMNELGFFKSPKTISYFVNKKVIKLNELQFPFFDAIMEYCISHNISVSGFFPGENVLGHNSPYVIADVIQANGERLYFDADIDSQTTMKTLNVSTSRRRDVEYENSREWKNILKSFKIAN